MSEKPLRRYTSLPILLDILNRRCLTFLDPQSWDDKNDSYFIDLYKDKLHFKTVLALCFTRAGERYHYWKIFSGNLSGVCIIFNDENLFNNIKNINGIKMGMVDYKLVNDLKSINRDISQLPFIKRNAFRDEKEFRIIYESFTEEIPSKEIFISLDSISEIVFNPWIPLSVFDSVKEIINKIDDCNKIPIKRTDLLKTDRWKRLGKEKFGSLITMNEGN